MSGYLFWAKLFKSYIINLQGIFNFGIPFRNLRSNVSQLLDIAVEIVHISDDSTEAIIVIVV